MESLTGQRYISQSINGGNVLFFVREYKKEGAFASPFTCIGFADSKPLWLGADQYCMEDEGTSAGVCDEEDGKNLNSYSPHLMLGGAI